MAIYTPQYHLEGSSTHTHAGQTTDKSSAIKSKCKESQLWLNNISEKRVNATCWMGTDSSFDDTMMT